MFQITCYVIKLVYLRGCRRERGFTVRIYANRAEDADMCVVIVFERVECYTQLQLFT